MLKSYDPKEVVLVVGGVPMSGFADGTFISVERKSDAFELVSGADGVASRSKTNDFTGSMTVTLSQTSQSNDILSAFAVADEATSTGVVPILLKDIGGSTVIFSAKGWIRKTPTVEYGKVINNREWNFDLADLDMLVGGNPNA